MRHTRNWHAAAVRQVSLTTRTARLRCPGPRLLGGSSNGRTTDSGSVYLGSNPSPPAKRFLEVENDWRPRPHRLAVRTSASHAGNAGSIPAGVATLRFGPSSPRHRTAFASRMVRFGHPRSGSKVAFRGSRAFLRARAFPIAFGVLREFQNVLRGNEVAVVGRAVGFAELLEQVVPLLPEALLLALIGLRWASTMRAQPRAPRR